MATDIHRKMKLMTNLLTDDNMHINHKLNKLSHSYQIHRNKITRTRKQCNTNNQCPQGKRQVPQQELHIHG